MHKTMAKQILYWANQPYDIILTINVQILLCNAKMLLASNK